MMRTKMTGKETMQFMRINSIREMESILFDFEIPKLHELQRTLPYNHLAVAEQLAIVDGLQNKVSTAKPY